MPPTSRKSNSTNAENEAWLVRACPFTYTLVVMGRRWRPAILWKLTAGPLHFAALARQLPRASEKMLSQDLRALEASGVIERRAEAGHSRYQLTPRGEELGPVLIAMHRFGERHREGIAGEPPRPPLDE